VAIQNITLDILYVLSEQTKLNPVPKQFQDAGGVQKLLAIIKVSHLELSGFVSFPLVLQNNVGKKYEKQALQV
jgi:hypothetical protein